jgi:hypothetical protein
MQVPAKIVKELLRTLPKDCEIYKKLYDAVKKE